ncbi:MAG: hypothetical protein Q8P24_12185 [Desulfobacterales bacterium]|nr:hypothetical protein [Desulfobacterales bacterium]
MTTLIKKWLFLIICTAALVVQPLPADANPLEPYIQAAKKEGSVTIATPLREKVYGKPAGELYMAAFQKRYPFLKVTYKEKAGGTREREKMISEMTAGIINFDVAPVSETDVSLIVSAKLPRIIAWEKLGVPKFLIHPENIGISFRTPVFGIAYNRDLIPDEVARTFTWETCTDPKWKGKTAIDDRPRHLEKFYMDDVWGREKTLDYAKRWAANKPSMEFSRSRSATKLTAGAYHMICGMARNPIERLQVYTDSKTVGIVYPEPVPVGIGTIIFVPDKAENPNAGILFLAWSGTKEAQNLIDRIDFTGHPAFEGNKINNIIQGKKIAYASWGETAGADDILTEILQTMGMPVVRSKKKK